MNILDFQLLQPRARSMRNAPNGARLALSTADIPAMESPGSAKDVTRYARGYSRFLDMSA